MSQTKNYLVNQTSPYLLQHAHNPVEWYPWCKIALQRAKQEDKPILLSIGYSACHWCHVMAHESFEDEATAKLMNELFINIKIDREERPDIDKIYQTAQYLLTQRTGGWPLTMFLTPQDQMPFFGGTYFPNEARHGLPAFKDLLLHIANFYQSRREEIDTQNQSMHTALKQIYEPTYSELDLSPNVLELCNQHLEQTFDAQHGGFGNAPKFPHPTYIERLLRYYAQLKLTNEDKPRALHAALYSLEKMAAGGIYDHLGGGFSRYSVDNYWMIPHFEKMLYDNGPLLALYAQAFSLELTERFKNVCEGTAGWLMREMQSPEGGYYSTLDADSEGEEGKFYVWSQAQIKEVLNDEEFAVFAPHFGIDRDANFEGKYHLHTFTNENEICQTQSISPTDFNNLLNSAKQKLFSLRESRIRPGRDDKILTSWNALMIRGMAIAGRILKRHEYIESAEHALSFLHNTMWSNQRLFATYKDGIAHLDAYLDDYAFLLDAILELLQVRWKTENLTWARQLADILLEQFEDKASGGFYFTANEHERLIQRPKTFSDDSTPSGNGVCALALARLGYLLGETQYLDAAAKTLKSAGQAINQSPIGHTSLLHAYEEQIYPPQIIILRGNDDCLDTWHAVCLQGYAPRRLAFAIANDVDDLPLGLTDKKYLTSSQQGVTAYICNGTHCDAPIEDLAQFKEVLAKTNILPRNLKS